jgi:hypothetical protein
MPMKKLICIITYSQIPLIQQTKASIKKPVLVLRTSQLPVVPPQLNCASQQFHLHGRNLKTAPLANGEVPVSFSLTLSGGFDKAPSTDFHYPGSLFDFTLFTNPDQHVTYIAFDALTIHYT